MLSTSNTGGGFLQLAINPHFTHNESHYAIMMLWRPATYPI
jgi:hypothetical protein